VEQVAAFLMTALTLLYKTGACKILMKLTPVVNFINILQAAFAPIFFFQKITKPEYN